MSDPKKEHPIFKGGGPPPTKPGEKFIPLTRPVPAPGEAFPEPKQNEIADALSPPPQPKKLK